MEPFAALVDEVLAGVRRTAPVALVGFPADDDWLDARGGAEPGVPNDRLELRRWNA